MATSWTCPRCARWHDVTAACELTDWSAWIVVGSVAQPEADSAEDGTIAGYWRDLARHLYER